MSEVPLYYSCSCQVLGLPQSGRLTMLKFGWVCGTTPSTVACSLLRATAPKEREMEGESERESARARERESEREREADI